MRGTDRRDTPAVRCARFIPACAGNSRSLHPRTRHRAVHPRVCGEQETTGAGAGLEGGSSPRVRGTGRPETACFQSHRFIPACAGNSASSNCAGVSVAVHPRVCGEQPDWSCHLRVCSGSSPRVRGTAVRCIHEHAIGRFIPACAGNRSITGMIVIMFPVHPRVCGEQVIDGDGTFVVGGSSPRVRGTEPLSNKGYSGIRFIPACAGNSGGGQPTAVHAAVHPRVCGEQWMKDALRSGTTGSSPRVRGTGAPPLQSVPCRRFIPACAGNRSTVSPTAFMPTVHPRVCGEQQGRPSTCPPSSGSSPRVRGTEGFH